MATIERPQLVAMHASAVALAAGLAALLAALDAEAKITPPPDTPDTPRGCKHARTQDVSTLGAPGAALCLDCGSELVAAMEEE